MAKHWRIALHDPSRIAALQRAANLSSVLAQLLVGRGISDANAVSDFLNPKLTSLRDPDSLPGARQAADLITAAIGDRRRIVVFGDYDADGITGTALLFRCLKLLGADVGYYLPNRLKEGYGLNDDALATLHRRGAKLIVTVDCGIASVEASHTARRLGLSLVVTDHHAPGETLPEADAIVHPGLPAGGYPFAGLCGAAVAFKLAWLLCQQASEAKRVGERMRQFLLQALGLAAIGTVADVVPLIDENRVLVSHGLDAMKQRPLIGMVELLRVTGLSAKPRLDSEDIGFSLAPRLNAAGRLAQAQLAVELLTTDDPRRAASLADYIHQLNESRASLERSVYLAANKLAKEEFDPGSDPALVLAGDDWHPGVIGIVAGRLAEKYHRPVVLISLDKLGVKPAVGSARTPAGWNLHEALARCGPHLIRHGGHAAAAGLQIEPGRIEAFRAEFCELAATTIAAEARRAVLKIDAETPLAALTLQTLREIDRLGPFGAENPRPMLCTSEVRLAEPPRRIGAGGRHASLRIQQHNVKLRAVAFGAGDWADRLADHAGPLEIAYRPVINHFRGRQTVELQLADWRPGEPADSTLGSGVDTVGQLES